MFRRTRLPQTMPLSASYQQPIQRLDAAFRPYESVGSHDQVISGLHHTACTPAVYAPQRELPHHHVRLASDWWPAFVGRDSLPAGSHSKVSAPILTTSSLTRLPWRTSGRPGQLPAQAPHRTGRADFPHPAPQVTDSLRDDIPSGQQLEKAEDST
jgi:hypothetical protein